MNDSPNPPPTVYQTPRKPSGGGGSCVLKGCLAVVVILMLLGVLFGSLCWYLWHSTEPFRTHEPVAIRTFQGGDAAFAATGQKLAAFNQSLAAGLPATLTLTGDDLNALVARDPRLSRYQDRVYLSVVNNQIVAETSFPMADQSGLRPDQRWYFNARAVLDASYSTGDFAFLLSRFEALDHRQPPALLLGFAKWYFSLLSRGFNGNFHEHPEQYGDLPQLTAQLRTISIQNSQIVVASVEHPKPAAVPNAPPAASPVAAPPETR